MISSRLSSWAAVLALPRFFFAARCDVALRINPSRMLATLETAGKRCIHPIAAKAPD